MNAGPPLRQHVRRQWIPVTLPGLAALLDLSLALTISTRRQQHQEDAIESASNIFRLDVIIRRWNARHGGFFVPITKSTLPHP